MNPLQRIKDLETVFDQLHKAVYDQLHNRLDKVEAELAQAKDGKPSMPAPAKRKAHAYPRPLSDEAKAIVLIVWECLSDADKPITMQRFWELVREADTDHLVPKGVESNGTTLRAIIAESAGLKVVWSKSVLRHASEDDRTMHLHSSDEED
jgi:hypothetical protein